MIIEKAQELGLALSESVEFKRMMEARAALDEMCIRDRNNFQVIVEDGVAKMPDRQSYAGSVATADRLIRVMQQDGGISLFEAVTMMTQNPARLLGIGEHTGSIAVGKEADLIIFDENVHVISSFVSGKEVEREDKNEDSCI